MRIKKGISQFLFILVILITVFLVLLKTNTITFNKIDNSIFLYFKNDYMGIKTNELKKVNYLYYPKNIDYLPEFKSLDKNICSIDKYGNVKGISEGQCNIELNYNGLTSNEKIYVNNTDILIQQILINEQEINLNINQEYQVNYNVYPKESNILNISYYSTDTNVATINDKGIIHANKKGSCFIYIISNNVKEKVLVNVYNNKDIKVNNYIKAINMNIDSFYTLDDYNIKTISISNDNVVLDNNHLIAKYLGNTKVILTYLDNSTSFININITNENIDNKELIIKEDYLELNKYESKYINFAINPINSTNKSVIFNTNDNNICTIDKYGKVTANNVGNCIISLSLVNGGITKNIYVDIKDKKNISTINIDTKDEEIDLNIYQSKNIFYEVSPSSKKDDVIFKSDSNKCIVYNGMILGLEKGTCNISINSDEITKNIKVNVKEQEIIGINTNTNRISMKENTTYYIYATTVPLLSNYKVYYESLDLDVCSINNGIIYALKKGVCHIKLYNNSIYKDVIVEIS